jgi:CDGSH-type Zn-finger protein
MTQRPSIECAPNGPLLVRGLENLVDLRDGRTLDTSEVVALCRCGASANKPFCDGQHAKVGFVDVKQEGRARDGRRDYAGEQITVHDNRGVCSHAAFCTDRLPAVFRHKESPWIAPDEAAVEEVIEIVEACPSGALSYSIGGVEHRDQENPAGVLVVPSGPYAVQGGAELDTEWGDGASREHFNLCRCGASKNKPFCDGAHWDSKFDDEAE